MTPREQGTPPPATEAATNSLTQSTNAPNIITGAYDRNGNPLLNNTAEAAEAYASLGLAVVPIVPGTKRPSIPNWPEKASTDPDTIRRWFTDDRLGVGIVTGEKSGVWVLDVDGKAGLESLIDLIEQYGELPPGPVSETGNGLHYLFLCPPGFDPTTNSAILGEGLDVRGTGGQIVAPPSIHPNGEQYRWADGADPWITPLPRAPEWLEARVQRPDPAQATPSSVDVTLFGSAGQTDDDLGRLCEQVFGNLDHLLGRDGWTRVRSKGDDTKWVRPGKQPKDGISAVTHKDGHVLVVFSTNAPPELLTGARTASGDGYVHNLFSYLAAMEFGGDRSKTAIHVRNKTGQSKPSEPWPAHQHEPEGDGPALSAGSWKTIDLRPHLYGEPPPGPEILARTDGVSLFYTNKNELAIRRTRIG